MIDNAGDDQQEIGQSIDVRKQMRLDMIRAERDNRPLGAATDSPRKVQQGTGTIAAGQDEAAQRWQFGLESIDPLFEPSNVGVGYRDFRDAFRDLFSRIGKPCADGEQVLLQLLDQSGDVPGELALRADSTQAGIQLVDIAIGRHARVSLRYPGPAKQRRATGVAGTRVNLHGRQYT